MHSIELVCFIAPHDWDLVSHQLQHYRKLGVNKFNYIAHMKVPSVAKELMRRNPDVNVVEVVKAPFTEILKMQTLSRVCQAKQGQWIVTVDADEFLEVPFENLRETIDCLEDLHMTSLPGFLVQRLTPDGSLPEITPAQDIQQTFSLYDFALCERMGLRLPTWKTKFSLAKVTDNYTVPRGFHYPHNHRPDTLFPIRAVVNHFKWRDRLKVACKLYRGQDTNVSEMSVYAQWLAANRERLPIAGAKPYSKKSMFEDGLLVKPSPDTLRFYRALHRLKGAGDLVTAELKQEFDDCLGSNDSVDLCKVSQLKKIGLVTAEFVGPGRCGGIGTATSALAELLAYWGHEVEIIFCAYRAAARLRPFDREAWECRGIKITDVPVCEGTTKAHRQRILNDYLMTGTYDILHFDDATDLPLGPVLLRKAGLGLTETTMIMTTHGNGVWHFRGNNTPWNPDEPYYEHALAIMLNNMDTVIHPSRYMHDHLNRFYEIPGEQIVNPNILSAFSKSFVEEDESRSSVGPVKEVVFFGRAEERKGIFAFATSMQAAAADLGEPVKVTLLGKIGGNLSKDLILELFEHENIDLEICERFDSVEAINLIRSKSCLVVVPSVQDNLPYTVYECLENGKPILSTDVGGIPELIAPEHHENVIVKNPQVELAGRIHTWLTKGGRIGTLAFDTRIVALKFLEIFGRQEVAKLRNHRSPQILEMQYPTPRFPGKPGEDGEALQWKNQREFISHLRSVLRASDIEYVLLHASGTRCAEKADLIYMVNAMAEDSYAAAVADYAYFKDTRQKRLLSKFHPVSAGPAVYSASRPVFGQEFALFKKDDLIKALEELPVIVNSPHLCWEILNQVVAGGKRVGTVPKCLVHVDIRTAPLRPLTVAHDFAARLRSPWVQGKTPVEAMHFAMVQHHNARSCPWLQIGGIDRMLGANVWGIQNLVWRLRRSKLYKVKRVLPWEILRSFTPVWIRDWARP